jgi:predicted transcriptional regulator
VLARRKVELGISQEAVRVASGLSTTTIANVEHADPNVTMASLRSLDVGLQWPVGTCESWLTGRAGVVSTSTATPDLASMSEQLSLIVDILTGQVGAQLPVALKLARLAPAARESVEVLIDQLLERGGR